MRHITDTLVGQLVQVIAYPITRYAVVDDVGHADDDQIAVTYTTDGRADSVEARHVIPVGRMAERDDFTLRALTEMQRRRDL